MKLLVTGANGFIGKQLVMNLLERGHEVFALLRSPASTAGQNHQNLNCLFCDLDKEQIPPLGGLNIDCVVHLAVSMNPDGKASYDEMLAGTNKLINEMHHAGIKKLIGISSLSVLDYESISALTLVDESVNVCSEYHRMGRYSALKALQELIFKGFSRSESEHCVILRPGLVYDQDTLITAHAGVIKNQLQLLIDHKGQVPLVSVNSVVDAIVQSAEVDLIGNQVIHLVDDDLPSQKQYQLLLLSKGKIKAGGMHIAWWLMLCAVIAMFPIAEFFKMLSYLPDTFLPHAYAARLKPFVFSNAKAKAELNWKPTSFNHHDL